MAQPAHPIPSTCEMGWVGAGADLDGAAAPAVLSEPGHCIVPESNGVANDRVSWCKA